MTLTSTGVRLGVAMDSLKFRHARPYYALHGGRPAAVFCSFGHSMPYAYVDFVIRAEPYLGGWRMAVADARDAFDDVINK
jgi:hypothetical protein